MADPYLLTEHSATKLRTLLSDGDKPTGYSPVPNESWAWVKRGSSAGTVSGTDTFNGRIQYRKGPGTAWVDAGTADVVLFAPNGETLESGKVYLCAPAGIYNGKPCFSPAPGSGSGGVINVYCDEFDQLVIEY